MSTSTLTNYWLRRENAAVYIKIVDWAQRHDLKVEELTREHIFEALKYKP